MSAPIKLSFGLNAGGAKKGSPGVKPPIKRSAFGSSALGADDDDDAPAAPIASTSKAKAAVGRPLVAMPPANTKLSKAQKQKQEEQLALDSTVFEYDEVFDQMKEATKRAQDEKKKESIDRKPKYIGRLLETAELRKQDRLRAEDKMVQREREREGDTFAEKDAFVTPAYLAQQEELRKVEEEEKKREEAEAGKSGGMTSFFKSYLDASSKEHEAAVAASLVKPTDGESKTSFNVAPPPREKTEAEIAAEVSASTGRKVEVNDDGEIIDKRQLMGGGLNIIRKPKSETEAGFSVPISQRATSSRDDSAYSSSASLVGQGLSPAERARQMRERQSRELERQMLELERKRKVEEEDELRSKVQKVQKRNDESKVEMLKRQAEERRLKRAEEAKKAAADAAAASGGEVA